jgi:hypothetical protein
VKDNEKPARSSKRHIKANSVNGANHPAKNGLRNALGACAVSEKLDQVRMVPVLPLTVAIGETKNSFVEDKNITLTTERDTAPFLSTGARDRFRPVRIVVLLR